MWSEINHRFIDRFHILKASNISFFN
jgi:hypothetical protein